MNETPEASEKVFSVSKIAKERAEAYGRDIGEPAGPALKKFSAIAQAMLSHMDIGEEYEFPIPADEATPYKAVVLKKVSDDAYSIRIAQ